MWDPRQYQLLDFGDGRRLERFGRAVLDRPCPAAERIQQATPSLWTAADARYDRVTAEPGRWTLQGEAASTWTIAYGDSHCRLSLRESSATFAERKAAMGAALVFELKRTDFGHVGLFPEQAENWDWLRIQVDRGMARIGRPLKLLNLFAYTGGSTLAAAAAGAEVAHVDAARNVVAWARRNAELSGLGQASIRWIAEDAMKFVRRELRRGNRYDAVVLDPPSYGHGVRGEAWQLDRHLPELLAHCAQLLASSPQCVLLTCHTPGYTPPRLRELLAASFAAASSATAAFEAEELAIQASTGRALPSGVVARWSARGA